MNQKSVIIFRRMFVSLVVAALIWVSMFTGVTEVSANPVSDGRISPYLVGNNVWYNPSNAVWNASSGAGLKMIRIGGIQYDRNMPSNAQLTDWVNRIKAMGAEPMIQVSQFRSASDAANLVRYFNKETNNTVKYWNIGNEPWLERNRPAMSTVASAVAGYVKSHASAMKAVDPTIKIFAPDECYYAEDLYNSLLGGANDITGKDARGNYYIDGISWHRYVGGDLATSGANDMISSMQKCRARIDYANKLRGRTGENALQWGIGEFNSNGGAGVASFANGMMFAQVYGGVMKYGGTYATTWSMFESGGNLGGTDFSFLNSNMTPRPSYYAMQMISNNFSGVYADGKSNVSSMRTYGAVDTTKISVMLVNVGSGGQACTVRLNNDAIAGSCTVNINAGLAATHTQQINGKTIMVLVFDKQGKLAKRVTYSEGGTPKEENLSSLVTPIPVTPTPMGPHKIPSQIEAENYSTMNGVETEATTDVGGGLNVGYFDPDDWMDYEVDVQTAGTYTVDLRMAGNDPSGTLQIQKGGTVLATVTPPNTGGWQTWQTVTTEVNLAAGKQTLRLYCSGDLFNINWIKFSTTQPTSTPTPSPTITIKPTTTSTPTPNVVVGDLNGDSSVNSIDFAYLRSYLIGAINEFPVENDLIAGDLNGDGAINSIDFALMRMFILGIIDRFNV